MLPKDQDLHNLHTPDPTQFKLKDFQKSSLKEATLVKIQNRFFLHKDEFSKVYEQSYYDEPFAISVRAEFDRWTEIDVKDFQLFGVECYKPKVFEPVTFQTQIVSHSTREVDNHGMNYDVVDSVCVILPDKFIEYIDKQVEIVVKVI